MFLAGDAASSLGRAQLLDVPISGELDESHFFKLHLFSYLYIMSQISFVAHGFVSTKRTSGLLQYRLGNKVKEVEFKPMNSSESLFSIYLTRCVPNTISTSSHSLQDLAMDLSSGLDLAPGPNQKLIIFR